MIWLVFWCVVYLFVFFIFVDVVVDFLVGKKFYILVGVLSVDVVFLFRGLIVLFLF